MTVITQPIRDAHRYLIPYIETLRKVADAVGAAPMTEVRRGLRDVYDFLNNHLIPHALAEDRVLYPAVAETMGAPEATFTMSRDHMEVERLTKELKVLMDQVMDRPVITDSQARGLHRVLYGLYTLVSVHFAKEEDIYLPLLDAKLGPEEAQKLFDAMEIAEREARERG